MHFFVYGQNVNQTHDAHPGYEHHENHLTDKHDTFMFRGDLLMT